MGRGLNAAPAVVPPQQRPTIDGSSRDFLADLLGMKPGKPIGPNIAALISSFVGDDIAPPQAIGEEDYDDDVNYDDDESDFELYGQYEREYDDPAWEDGYDDYEYIGEGVPDDDHYYGDDLDDY